MVWKKYKQELQSFRKEENTLIYYFIPLSLYLLKVTGYQYNTMYDHYLRTRLQYFHEYKDINYYLQLLWAKKIASSLLGLGITSVIAVGTGEIDAILMIFSLLVLLVLFFLPDYELQEKIKKKQLNIKLDFPDFINKLALLINAGMTINRAWEKVVMGTQKNSPLYEELQRSLVQIKNGRSEIETYEEFAKRCKVSEITRFITVILQNKRKGHAELVSILRLQATECWEMRKNTAKKLGEEASTKLLFPMMLMLLAIIIIVATPAVFAIKGMY